VNASFFTSTTGTANNTNFNLICMGP
jgi:hypothetical protein